MRQLPPSGGSEREISFAVRQLIDGRGNYHGRVTLTPGATSTLVSRTNANANAFVFLFPMSANAAAAVATTYILSTDITKDGFTVRHANAATGDRTFAYIMVGG